MRIRPGGAPPSTMPPPNVAGPSSTLVAEKEACGTEAGPDAALVEGVPDEKGSPISAIPPS